MQWLADPTTPWVLVALGGAVGSTLGLLLVRRPSRQRLLVGTAVTCGLLGVRSAYPFWPALTDPLTFGVLGSAASMLLFSTAPPLFLDSQSIWRTTRDVTKRLAVYCAVGVTFALAGYLAVRAGITLYVKLR